MSVPRTASLLPLEDDLVAVRVSDDDVRRLWVAGDDLDAGMSKAGVGGLHVVDGEDELRPDVAAVVAIDAQLGPAGIELDDVVGGLRSRDAEDLF